MNAQADHTYYTGKDALPCAWRWPGEQWQDGFPTGADHEALEAAGKVPEYAYPHPSAWQPIETAPKDGTWVLLSGGKTTEIESMYERVRLERPVTAFWEKERDRWAFCYWDGMWRENYEGPTHWRALP